MQDNPHLVARLESFSDIVIGFSLAQTAINLVVTTNIEYFFAHPVGIVAYLATFGFVVRIWWTHSTIMHRYFEPNRLMVALNFIALAALGLFVFGLQLWMRHGGDDAGQMLAARFYFVCLAIVLGTLALMRLLGAYFRREHLSPETRRTATGRSISMILISTLIVAGAVVPTNGSETLFGEPVTTAPVGVFYGMILGAILGRTARLMITRSRFGEPTAEATRA